MKIPKVIRQNEGVRVVVRTAAELVDEGKDDKGKYVGGKWGGLYLRAPDIYFRILEKAGDKMVRLGDVADVRRGFTTGANEFFYLKPLDLTVKEVAELREKDPTAPVRMRNGADWEGEIEAAWLRPVIKSPRETQTLRVRLEDLSYLVFMPPEGVREDIKRGKTPLLSHHPKAAAYICWGEERGYHQNRTCAARQIWWLLPEEKGNNFWGKELRERIGIFISDKDMHADCRLYTAHLSKVMQGALNSTLSIFVDEMGARQYGGGGGPRSVMVYEVKNLPIINPQLIPSSPLLSAFELLANRPIRNIFEELGFSLCRERWCKHPYENVHPEELTLEQIQKASPDRFELDRVVFDVLGLTEGERLEVYQAVVRLVKDRLTKAKSNTN